MRRQPGAKRSYGEKFLKTSLAPCENRILRTRNQDLLAENSVAELCRSEGMAQVVYDSWSEEYLEADMKRPAGGTACAATSNEFKDLRREARN